MYHWSSNFVVVGLVNDELEGVAKDADVAVEVVVVCPCCCCSAVHLACSYQYWPIDAGVQGEVGQSSMRSLIVAYPVVGVGEYVARHVAADCRCDLCWWCHRRRRWWRQAQCLAATDVSAGCSPVSCRSPLTLMAVYRSLPRGGIGSPCGHKAEESPVDPAIVVMRLECRSVGRRRVCLGRETMPQTLRC